MARREYNSMIVALILLLEISRQASGSLPNDIIQSITSTENNAVKAANLNNLDPVITEDTISMTASFVPSWFIFTEFGFDRQRIKSRSFTAPGTLGDLEYSQRSDANGVFIEILWLPNDDRLHRTVVHLGSGFSLIGIPTGASLPDTQGDIGACSYATYVTEASSPNQPSIVNLHFTMYRHAPYMPTQASASSSVVEKIHQTTFEMEYPKRVALGHVLLGKSSGTMTPAEIEAIMGILGPKVCAQLSNSAFDCCDQGTPGTATGGEPDCTCNAGFHGACCDKTCIQGTVVALAPHGSEICKCDLGWGGDKCDIESRSDHFVSMMKYQAQECQDKITNHIDYPYYNLVTDHLDFPLQTSDQANRVYFGIDGSTLQQVTYGQRYSSPLKAVSETTNDFLFSAAVETPNTISSFEIKVDHSLVSDPLVDQSDVYTNTTQVGSCRATVHTIQKYGSGTDATMVEIFMVVGQIGYSTFPTTVEIVNPTMSINAASDTWKISGTDMTGLITAYVFAASEKQGAIDQGELIEMADCYVRKACASLPTPDCKNGNVEETDGTLSCVCDDGFIGQNCHLPLC